MLLAWFLGVGWCWSARRALGVFLETSARVFRAAVSASVSTGGLAGPRSLWFAFR